MAEYHYRKAAEIHPNNAVLLGCVGMVRPFVRFLLACFGALPFSAAGGVVAHAWALAMGMRASSTHGARAVAPRRARTVRPLSMPRAVRRQSIDRGSLPRW
jgi:hypothetical protein